MQEINTARIVTERSNWDDWHKKEVSVSMLRLDRIHPQVSGNKWFKLRFYLDDAIKHGKKSIVTFGGAWSNHILATAAACKLYNLRCTGIIRGEEPLPYSSTLRQAESLGMHLVFISRAAYREKSHSHLLGDEYVIPEGGYGALGAAGAATILEHCNRQAYTHICCAAGTGTMLAGLVASAAPGTTVLGFSVLKNNKDLREKTSALLAPEALPFEVIHDFHFGGYAKYNAALINFMNRYFSGTNIPTDFVYTGKLCYGVNEFILGDQFPPGSNILLIHSGGLQGNDSLEKGTLIF
jgi:1-aminocyclopropane-1-carboxylate deaminase